MNLNLMLLEGRNRPWLNKVRHKNYNHLSLELGLITIHGKYQLEGQETLLVFSQRNSTTIRFSHLISHQIIYKN